MYLLGLGILADTAWTNPEGEHHHFPLNQGEVKVVVRLNERSKLSFAVGWYYGLYHLFRIG